MASRMYKLEILRRFNEGNILTKEFLIENNYLDCLTEQDIRSSLPIEEVSALEDLEMELKINFVLAKYLNIITEPSEWEKNYYYIENYRIIGLKIRTSKEKSIPEAIGKFKKMRYLNLSNNYFSRLPESIGELKNLEKLDIYNNKFKEIPNRIKELKRLRILDLRDNELKNIPSMVKDIGSLEILYLEKNPIPNLPKEIGNLEKTNSNRYIKKNREKF